MHPPQVGEKSATKRGFDGSRLNSAFSAASDLSSVSTRFEAVVLDDGDGVEQPGSNAIKQADMTRLNLAAPIKLRTECVIDVLPNVRGSGNFSSPPLDRMRTQAWPKLAPCAGGKGCVPRYPQFLSPPARE